MTAIGGRSSATRWAGWATVGSFALGFGVMTGCTNSYSCGTSGCEPCAGASALLLGGWVLQGALFVGAVALLVPYVRRRFQRSTVVGLALVVPLVSIQGG